MSRSIFGRIAGVLGARTVSAVVNLLTISVFIRTLGAANFGSFVLFRGITQVIFILAGLGIDIGIEKRLSESADGSILLTGSLLKIPPLLIVCALIAVVTAPVDAYIGQPVGLLLIPAIVLSSVNKTLRHALRGIQKVEISTSIKAGERVILLVVGAVVSEFGAGLEGVILVFIATLFIGSVACLLFLPLSLGAPSTNVARSLMDFSKYGIFPTVIGPMVFAWTDTLVVGWFLPQEFVSAYEAAWNLSKTSTLLSGAVATASFPQISDWDTEERMDKIQEFIPTALVVSLALVVPASVGAIYVGKDLLRILFTPSSTIAFGALIVLFFARIPLAVSNVVGRVLLGIDQAKLVARMSIVLLVLNITGNLVLTPRYGLVGAATATSLAALVNSTLLWYYCRKFVSFKPPVSQVRLLLGATVIMAIALDVLRRTVDFEIPLSTTLFIIVGVVCYSLALGSSPTIRRKLARLMQNYI